MTLVGRFPEKCITVSAFYRLFLCPTSSNTQFGRAHEHKLMTFAIKRIVPDNYITKHRLKRCIYHKSRCLFVVFAFIFGCLRIVRDQIERCRTIFRFASVHGPRQHQKKKSQPNMQVIHIEIWLYVSMACGPDGNVCQCVWARFIQTVLICDNAQLFEMKTGKVKCRRKLISVCPLRFEEANTLLIFYVASAGRAHRNV